MAKAIFHPQVWLNNYVIEVDPLGDTIFEVGDVPEDWKDDEYETNDLRYHDNAPQWIKDWYGPFWIEVLRD